MNYHFLDDLYHLVIKLKKLNGTVDTSLLIYSRNLIALNSSTIILRYTGDFFSYVFYRLLCHRHCFEKSVINKSIYLCEFLVL